MLRRIASWARVAVLVLAAFVQLLSVGCQAPPDKEQEPGGGTPVISEMVPIDASRVLVKVRGPDDQMEAAPVIYLVDVDRRSGSKVGVSPGPVGRIGPCSSGRGFVFVHAPRDLPPPLGDIGIWCEERGWRLLRISPVNSTPRCSPTGGSVAFCHAEMPGEPPYETRYRVAHSLEHKGIWVVQVHRDTTVQVTHPGENDVDLDPVWSPDGRQIVFTRMRHHLLEDTTLPDYEADLWVADTDGSSEQQITSFGDAVPPVLWRAPAGPVFFLRGVKGIGSDSAAGVSLWRVDPSGEGAREVLSADHLRYARDQGEAVISPDGSQIAVRRRGESAGPEGSDVIRIVNTATGGWQAVTARGPVGVCSWAHDGKSLFFVTSRRELWRVDVDRPRRPELLWTVPS